MHFWSIKGVYLLQNAIIWTLNCFLGCKIYLSKLNVQLEKGSLRWANQNINAKLEKVNFEDFFKVTSCQGGGTNYVEGWGCSQPITGIDITIGRLRSGAIISRFKYAMYDWVVKEAGQWYRLVEYIQSGGWGVGQSHLVKMPRHKVT